MQVASLDDLFYSAIFGFDDASLEAWLTRRTGASASDVLLADVARAWLALMRGDAAAAAAGAAELLTRASAGHDPSRVIELTTLQAMLALSAGQLGDAAAFARRASRLARTEALPAAELLAHITLARLRRFAGKPYLARRILDSLGRSDLGRVAPGWLEWERFFAGGAGAVEPSGDAGVPSVQAQRAGWRALCAARGGRRVDFEQHAAELVRTSAGFSDMQREARALCALLDPERPAQEPLAGFRRGERDELWHGLSSVHAWHAESEPSTHIVAAARPGERGSRLLRDGLALFGPCRTFFEDGARVRGRTDAALSVLVLAGPVAQSEEAFFQRVYGFAYAGAKHRGVLDVLLHRVRQRIAASGALLRANGGLRLELREAIAVADPRCSPPAAARVLSALSRQPAATAEAIAQRLGITPRAAQMALRELVSDGACEVRRSGRHVRYQLLDSTFSEPSGPDVFG